MLDLLLWQFFLIECGMLLTAWFVSRFRSLEHAIGILEAPFRALANRPVLCIALIVVFTTVLRLALIPIQPIPHPLFHDEFSYLLGADTFAHGRLTNPTPPVPIAFETIHTNMWPSYSSMYMPGTALLLSMGMLAGSPWIAVLLVKVLLCAAVYWMVSGWLPRGYALASSLVAIGITCSMNWWWDNYFCIALSALGAALVFGSLPRIEQRKNWYFAAVLGVGLAILILTRPYEGFCVAFPAVLLLLVQLRSGGFRLISKLAVAPLLILAALALWFLYDNHRVTGQMLAFPYTMNFKQYHITGPFIFSARHPLPAYHLDILRRFYIFAEVPQYIFLHEHPWLALVKKINVYYSTIALGFAAPVLMGCGYLLFSRRSRLWLVPLASLLGFCINVLLMGWSPFPQYAAPAFPLMILLIAFGLYGLRSVKLPWVSGVRLVRGLVFTELLFTLSVFGFNAVDNRNIPEPHYVSIDRQAVEKQVLSHPGKQLCLVRYTPFHESWQEWVFNGADLTSEKLIWARSLDAQTDRALLKAFPDRTVWLVEPDFAGRLLQPYTEQAPYFGGW